jgi:uncharacterized DUF497 family protein
LASGRWTWDPKKEQANRAKHGLSLALGALVLDHDPLATTRADPHPGGDRWQTIGSLGGVVLLLVVSTDPADEAHGRIISVRKATKQERQAYEEGSF